MQTTNPNPTTATTSVTATFVHVTLEDKAGELGRCAGVLAKAGINLEGFNCTTDGVSFLVANPTQATQVLEQNKFECETVELFAVRVNNQPGQLARIGEELGKAGINIETCFGVAGQRENGRIFLQVEDPTRARPIIEKIVGQTTTTQAPGKF